MSVIAVPFHTPVLIVPTLVRLLLTTALPRLVASKTLVPAILYSLALAIFTCSLNVHASVASIQLIVLSVVPLRVIPPPSAVTSLGVATTPISMFLSSISKVSASRVTVVPATVKLPAMLTLPPTPTPPVTIKAPVPEEVETVALVVDSVPLVAILAVTPVLSFVECKYCK